MTTLARQIVLVGNQHKDDLFDIIKDMGYSVTCSATGDEYLSKEYVNKVIFVYDEWEDAFFEKLAKSGAYLLGPTVVRACAAYGEDLPLSSRPLCALTMRGVVVCFTGFRVREDLHRMAAQVHWLGGSVRKEVSRQVTHLVALSSGGEKYDKAFVLGVHVVSREWVEEAWKLRCEPLFNVCSEPQFGVMRPFEGNTLAFFGFSEDETRHMSGVAEDHGALVVEPTDPMATHLVINHLSVRSLPELLLAHALGETLYKTEPEEHNSPRKATSFTNHNRRLALLRCDWFWLSVQMNMQVSVGDYRWRPSDSTVSTPGGTPGSTGRKRRRDEVQRTLAALAGPDEFRSSSISTNMNCASNSSKEGIHSISASFLDVTADNSAISEAGFQIKTPPLIFSPPVPLQGSGLSRISIDSVSSISATSVSTNREVALRFHKALELAQTELNYTKILRLVTVTAREELASPDQPGGAILPASDLQLIFSALPPIFELHKALSEALQKLVDEWSDSDSCVGVMYTSREEAFVRAYPPCINFLEHIKAAITDAERRLPRFHAYLKRFPSRPEAGRQSLSDNLTRLVQRLPSKMLILRDMRKATPCNHPDCQPLDEAIAALQRVMLQCNEDKRRTESYVQLFDLFNDIEGCPAWLLSAHRELVTQVDALELLGGSERGVQSSGDNLALFLFRDCLEITKRRRLTASSKSPRNSTIMRITPRRNASSAGTGAFTSVSLVNSRLGEGAPTLSNIATTVTLSNNMSTIAGSAHGQPLKHRSLVQLAFVRKVLDIVDPVCDSTDTRKICGLVVRAPMEAREKLICFALTNEDVDKAQFLHLLCRQVAEAAFHNDLDNLLVTMVPNALGIDPTEVFNKTLSTKAKRLGKRVTRVFSFTRTPKQRLTRAVSNLTDVSKATLLAVASPTDSLTSRPPIQRSKSPSWSVCSEMCTEYGRSARRDLSPPMIDTGRTLSCAGMSTTSLASVITNASTANLASSEQWTAGGSLDADAFFGEDDSKFLVANGEAKSAVFSGNLEQDSRSSLTSLRRPRPSIVKTLRNRMSRAFRRPASIANSTCALLMPPPVVEQHAASSRRSLLKPGRVSTNLERDVVGTMKLSKISLHDYGRASLSLLRLSTPSGLSTNAEVPQASPEDLKENFENICDDSNNTLLSDLTFDGGNIQTTNQKDGPSPTVPSTMCADQLPPTQSVSSHSKLRKHLSSWLI